jgi:hypothetical protein
MSQESYEAYLDNGYEMINKEKEKEKMESWYIVYKFDYSDTDSDVIEFDGEPDDKIPNKQMLAGVITLELALKAPLALTGTPTAPTAAAGTNTTQIATTAQVHSAITADASECYVSIVR